MADSVELAEKSTELAAVLARPGVERVFRLLQGAGDESRLVGGSVRNALLGLPVTDIDIATTLLPEAVMARAAAAGMTAVPTGIRHGTVTLVVDGAPYEVTTLREDIGTDGRRATVRFGRDFRIDAHRRDFTINALSVGTDHQIHDYAAGLADLSARRVRFIGDAGQRIREDYLRILRFFRFAAMYGDGRLDPAGLAAVQRHRSGLAKLSRERVRAEVLKLLAAPHAMPVLSAMADSGILADVLGSPVDLPRLRRLLILQAAHGVAGDPLRHLMALAMPDAASIAQLRSALRLTNREVARMDAVQRYIDHPSDPLEMRYRLENKAFFDAILLQGAATGADIDGALALARDPAPTYRLSGKDLIALGVPKGPEVSRLLAAAEAQWLASGLPDDEEDQRMILQQVLQQHPP